MPNVYDVIKDKIGDRTIESLCCQSKYGRESFDWPENGEPVDSIILFFDDGSGCVVEIINHEIVFHDHEDMDEFEQIIPLDSLR